MRERRPSPVLPSSSPPTPTPTRRTLRVAATAIAFAAVAGAASPGAGAPLFAATAAGDDPSAPTPTQPEAVLGTHVLETRGHVVSVDPSTNSVTLSGERGRHVTFEVEPQVADVSKLAVGDQIDIVYRHALLLRADRSGTGSGIRSRVETTTTTPAMGGVTTTSNHVEVTATVRRINRASRELTLRGPTETIMLDVPPNVPIDDLRIGDKVRATYVTQSALKVTHNGQPIH